MSVFTLNYECYVIRHSQCQSVSTDVQSTVQLIAFSRPPQPRKQRSAFRHLREQYEIVIKPKLQKSNSLSDLTNTTSEFNFDLSRYTDLVPQVESGRLRCDWSGDCADSRLRHCGMWNNRDKKTIQKDAGETSCSRNAREFAFNQQEFNEDLSPKNSSIGTDEMSLQKGAAFPFKPTPSGNFKVQSNQVVFQSSTVGVLLADPSQAKIKVKFEDKANGERDEELSDEFKAFPSMSSPPPTHFGLREAVVQNVQVKSVSKEKRTKPTVVREDKGKALSSLGYMVPGPVDWMRIQLPKKQDLMHDFYRRIHNYVNTDTIVHIGDEEFHCHHIVLEIYSTFFDKNPQREVELPVTNVSPEAFHTIYEWMINSGNESMKAMKRENILELFCAAQFLAIKDLEDQCWSFIVNETLFNEDTAFALYREAKSKGLTPVVDLMVPRVMRFFLPLVASKDFLELEPDEVMTFLRSNYICISSEIEVLMAGVRWLYGDWPNRQQYCEDVMRCVRFGLISPWQLVDIKRNPDNAEILDIVNEPEVQQMVDDGLAYVIIKYWYGNNSKNYYHWIDVLALSEPAERNWIGEEMNHVTYKDFLKYLEQFMIPKDQMYQHMAMNKPARKSEDVPALLRGNDRDSMEARRPKADLTLPSTLKAFANDKSLPTMSELFESRKKSRQSSRSPILPRNSLEKVNVPNETEKNKKKSREFQSKSPERTSTSQPEPKIERRSKQHSRKESSSAEKQKQALFKGIYDPVQNNSAEDMNTTNSETSVISTTSYGDKKNERHTSVAACFLAAATAALANSKSTPGSPPPTPSRAAQTSSATHKADLSAPLGPKDSNQIDSPQISLFRQSKESLGNLNMNKLSISILGPSNKNYITDVSLFNWDRETVLVFGGIDPHTDYGGKNTGKDVYRYDLVANVWENVGELPEPRHHHAVAFLRGRIYLVGGADPRDDDIRGKSVVVSTVWSYEPVTRSWFSESGLATPRKNFGLVVHKMALYAIGGQDKKGKVLRSVERFDPKTGSWAEVRPMAVARMAVATTKYREYIWVAGGMTGEKKKPLCKVVECYNSKTNEWTQIHNLRFPRCFATLFSMYDQLYLIGGAGRLSDKEKSASSVGAIDVWDWKEREWKLRTEMSIPRHGHAFAYLGTQLFIIGGVTTIYMRALNNVESYCCERGAWIRGVAALPSPLSGHGAVTLPPASLM